MDFFGTAYCYLKKNLKIIKIFEVFVVSTILNTIFMEGMML